jgi:hypothetical protein
METSYTLRDVELALKCLETRRRVLRESYYRNKEKRQAYAKERYAQKLADQGIQVRATRGRPPKNDTPPTPIENECVEVAGI